VIVDLAAALVVSAMVMLRLSPPPARHSATPHTVSLAPAATFVGAAPCDLALSFLPELAIEIGEIHRRRADGFRVSGR
jgi:hypothetical protein